MGDGRGLLEHQNDDQLLVRARQAEYEQATAALGELLRRSTGVIVRQCRLRGLTGEEVQEACQATFLAACRGFASCRSADGPAFGAWIRTIARREISGLIERRGPAALELEDTDGHDGAPSPGARLELRDCLRRCFLDLPVEWREAVLLQYDGLSLAQIGAEISGPGTPEGTAAAWVSKGRASLRECLRRQGLEPAIRVVAS